jgi:DNA-binding transcriptional LysR family regulator
VISTRQIEALIWTVRLGTLSRAAKRLHAAQPTISKRLQELDLVVGFKVFEPVGRSVKLTFKGEELYQICEKIWQQLSRVEELRGAGSLSPTRLAIGVTELAAQTWIAKMVEKMRIEMPHVVTTLTVGHSAALRAKLRSGELDLIVCAAFTGEGDLSSIKGDTVEFALSCSSRLLISADTYSGKELSEQCLLSHGPGGVLPAFDTWMTDLGFQPRDHVFVDSLVAQVGMTIAGMGLAVLPYACFSSMFSSGLLRKVATQLPLEPVPYRIYMRGGVEDGIIGKAAEIVASVCNFSESFDISLRARV